MTAGEGDDARTLERLLVLRQGERDQAARDLAHQLGEARGLEHSLTEAREACLATEAALAAMDSELPEAARRSFVAATAHRQARDAAQRELEQRRQAVADLERCLRAVHDQIDVQRAQLAAAERALEVLRERLDDHARARAARALEHGQLESDERAAGLAARRRREGV